MIDQILVKLFFLLDKKTHLIRDVEYVLLHNPKLDQEKLENSSKKFEVKFITEKFRFPTIRWDEMELIWWKM